MVPEKELQPRAFSIMPLVWTIGSIFGPSFGGFFAKPVENLPALFKDSSFFEKYPFELPNLVATILFLVGISTGVLFLRVRVSPINSLPGSHSLRSSSIYQRFAGNSRDKTAPDRLRPRSRQTSRLLLQDRLSSSPQTQAIPSSFRPR